MKSIVYVMNERKRTEDKLNDKTFYNVSKKKSNPQQKRNVQRW